MLMYVNNILTATCDMNRKQRTFMCSLLSCILFHIGEANVNSLLSDLTQWPLCSVLLFWWYVYNGTHYYHWKWLLADLEDADEYMSRVIWRNNLGTVGVRLSLQKMQVLYFALTFRSCRVLSLFLCIISLWNTWNAILKWELALSTSSNVGRLHNHCWWPCSGNNVALLYLLQLMQLITCIV